MIGYEHPHLRSVGPWQLAPYPRTRLVTSCEERPPMMMRGWLHAVIHLLFKELYCLRTIEPGPALANQFGKTSPPTIEVQRREQVHQVVPLAQVPRLPIPTGHREYRNNIARVCPDELH
jgi:hypothetical protein